MDYVSDRLVSIASKEVAKGRGTCILYLVEPHENVKLRLFKSMKEDSKLVIKAKEGDLFDTWVLKHANPLLIEDIKNDFRFDLNRLEAEHSRHISSLISAPLISENRFIALLRIDNPGPGTFAQDDLRFLATISDFGAIAIENGQLFQRTQELAIRDGLTSFYRKEYFIDRLKEELKRSLRQKKPLSILMLDIDFFKKYNDTYGHTAGDLVLKRLTQCISENLAEYEPILCRFGGEEFCIALTHRDKEEAFAAAENLRKAIGHLKLVLRRQPTNVTVSIGVASCPKDSTEEEDLLFKADKALYDAKKSGRNKTVIFS